MLSGQALWDSEVANPTGNGPTGDPDDDGSKEVPCKEDLFPIDQTESRRTDSWAS